MTTSTTPVPTPLADEPVNAHTLSCNIWTSPGPAVDPIEDCTCRDRDTLGGAA